MIGRRLAHYEILARLGEGGMEHKRRVTQEAKAASAINHLAIVTMSMGYKGFYSLEIQQATKRPAWATTRCSRTS